MNKTEASEALGLEIYLYAKAEDKEIDRDLVEARYSECFYSKKAIHQAIIKARPHWKTILRAALSYA